MKTPDTFGQRIQAARRSLGITQGELAAILGVPQQSVSSWERDRTIPSGPGMSALVKFFGIDEQTFRTGAGFEVPLVPRTAWMDQGGLVAAEEGAKGPIVLPNADPGEAWAVVVGTDERRPLTKEQALDLVHKVFEEGDSLWVVVKPRGNMRPARDLISRKTRKS